jgi:hypothetical protein
MSYFTDELDHVARRWEDNASACQTVRSSKLGDEHEDIALINREMTFERCAKEIRSVIRNIEEMQRVEDEIMSKTHKKAHR